MRKITSGSKGGERFRHMNHLCNDTLRSNEMSDLTLTEVNIDISVTMEMPIFTPVRVKSDISLEAL